MSNEEILDDLKTIHATLGEWLSELRVPPASAMEAEKRLDKMSERLVVLDVFMAGLIKSLAANVETER